jgi:uncharacterized protein YaiL (DUF2058 family)
MSESLRDQLLKSGLVRKREPEPKTESKPAQQKQPAKPHAAGARPQQRPMVPKKAPVSSDVDLARAYALRARQEKEEHERLQRETERIAREKKERKQKLGALLEGKTLNAADADVPRHFPHGNKIRRIYCTADQLTRLNRGELAVVQMAGRYLLVEHTIAVQAQAIQPEALVLLCDPNAPPEDDVPADLVW